MKKNSAPVYETSLGRVVSSRYVSKCDATLHTVKVDNNLHKVWQDGNNPATIGAEIAIDIRDTDGKAYMS